MAFGKQSPRSLQFAPGQGPPHEAASLCGDTGDTVCGRPANPRGLFRPQEFIRLGSLSKLSGKGLQQRMFFLVSVLAAGGLHGDG